MTVLLTIIHVVIAVTLILVVLLQVGKGAGIGAAFGGASDTVFGSRGPTGFLGKLTSGAAVGFMMTSLLLSYLAARQTTSSIVPASPLRTQTQRSAPVAKPPAPTAEKSQGKK
ncbi:MAG: preprotein translocase subunit SecG [Nitrospinota bacterium]